MRFFKKLLFIQLIILTLSCTVNAEDIFTDVSSGHWAYEHICNVYKKGLINGYPDKTFRPEELVTRGEFCKILLNSAGLDAYKMENPTGHWAYPYMTTLKDCTWSYEDWYLTDFNPDVFINRGEAALGISEIYLGHPYCWMNPVKQYNDKANFGGFHECIAVVSHYNLMNGYDDGCFHPEYNITRAELCAIVDRAFGNLGQNEIYNSSQIYNR